MSDSGSPSRTSMKLQQASGHDGFVPIAQGGDWKECAPAGTVPPVQPASVPDKSGPSQDAYGIPGTGANTSPSAPSDQPIPGEGQDCTIASTDGEGAPQSPNSVTHMLGPSAGVPGMCIYRCLHLSWAAVTPAGSYFSQGSCPSGLVCVPSASMAGAAGSCAKEPPGTFHAPAKEASVPMPMAWLPLAGDAVSGWPAWTVAPPPQRTQLCKLLC